MYQKIWNGLKAIGDFLQSPFLLLIRLYWGYQLIISGWGKFHNLSGVSEYFQSLSIPFPYFHAILVSGVELFGGLLLLLGLFSRFASIALLGLFIGAYATAESEAIKTLVKDFDPAPFFSATPFLFGYVALLVFLFGPGKLSLDYWLSGHYKDKSMP